MSASNRCSIDRQFYTGRTVHSLLHPAPHLHPYPPATALRLLPP